MERIASFSVDHNRIDCGMYTSRIDYDIVTYDIRMVKPNTPPYLENDGIHTLEHLFATYARNSKAAAHVIYVGPMGCRTGFYLLVKGLEPQLAIELVKDSMQFVAGYTGEIPGTRPEECGNYQEHSLPKAKEYAAKMCEVLKNWRVEDLAYPGAQ